MVCKDWINIWKFRKHLNWKFGTENSERKLIFILMKTTNLKTVILKGNSDSEMGSIKLFRAMVKKKKLMIKN